MREELQHLKLREVFSEFVASYSPEIELGLQKDDLWTRLKTPIEDLRRYFFSHSSVGETERSSLLFDEALNDYLILQKSFLSSPLW